MAQPDRVREVRFRHLLESTTGVRDPTLVGRELVRHWDAQHPLRPQGKRDRVVASAAECGRAYG